MFYPSKAGGGVKRYLLGKRDFLTSTTNHEHAIIIPDKKYSIQEASVKESDFRLRGIPLFWNPTYRFLLNPYRVRRALNQVNPDIIEVGSPYTIPWLVHYVNTTSRAQRRPLIMSYYHADFPRADFENVLGDLAPPLRTSLRRVGDWYAAKVFNLFEYTLVATEVVQKRLRSIGINNTVLMPFGIDTKTFRPIPDKRDDGDSRIKLLYAGRLSGDKRIMPWAEAMAAEYRKGNLDHVLLDFAGTGYLKEKLEKLFEGISQVRFLDYIHSKEELIKEYTAHDLLVVTSPYETFCFSALEAMASGTPVVGIVDEHSALQSLIQPKTGFLFPLDLKDFFAFLNRVQKAQLIQMRPFTREFVVNHYDQDRCYTNLIQFYESAWQEHAQLKRHSKSA